MENSWIAQNIPGPIDLLPRLQSQINQFYPGTKLAITEYNYGGGGEIAGAIAEADALGIFGRQGLYSAAEWPSSSNESYIDAAFDMYRNFDGADGAFGDTSIQAGNNDTTDASIYASIDSTNPNPMTLVAINKTGQPLTANMLLNHVQPGSTATFYQLTTPPPLRRMQAPSRSAIPMTSRTVCRPTASPRSASTWPAVRAKLQPWPRPPRPRLRPSATPRPTSACSAPMPGAKRT